MELSPYLENLQRDLTAAAAPGGEDIARAAGLLAGSLDASARLCLMEALSDAAAEITSKLSNASVEVRLRGRDADLVVTEALPELEQPIAAAATPPPTEGEQARITLRLPEQLKEAVERAAAAEGVSVNAWLVRALWTATQPAPPPGPGFRPGPGFPPGPGQGFHPGRRITGYAQS